MSHVVVVGSGIAGLLAALGASRHHDVTVVTKAELAESNTRYAQGGIAAALFPDDSVAAHVADTLRAGAGLGDRRIVEILCAEGPERVRELIALGVAFDRDATGRLARGHEAAHSARRVIHARGDATGEAIELALVAAVRSRLDDLREFAFLTDLVIRDGAVAGVSVLTAAGESVIAADAVILATGGAGQLYPHTTNPEVATGDGVAAALRAGAVLADLEFYQFHPTSLAVPGNPLISEAVRGEGAVLLTESGERFMLDLHPAGELAPRDVVARGIAAQMAAQAGRPVLLDASGLGRSFLTERFPGVTAVTAAHGLDWAAAPIPVTPAAHYWMGGIRTDDAGRTSIPGLYAVGEVAATGVHGANRLASNSLLEALVFARRAAAALAVPGPWPAPEFALPSASASEIQELAPDLAGPLGESRSSLGSTPEFPTASALDRAAIQRTMWDAAGLYRSGAGLRAASAALASPAAPGGTVHDRENRNLLALARAVIQAAEAREESRGAHFRSDFPAADPGFARNIAVARRAEVLA